MKKLTFHARFYDDGQRKYPGIYIYWGDVEEFLGELHVGDADQDQRLVRGLLAAGAPPWVEEAVKWVDGEGWGLYYNSYYFLMNRADSNKGKDIGKERAEGIIKNAEPLTGPYETIGATVDQVIYEHTVGDIIVRAIRCKGRWLKVPRRQNLHIGYELDKNQYEG